ncbi:helix-turn-helix transcriptional regulator [Sphingobacterium sp. UT-1RO-CII-1]|uniref:helix-turn-helix domain-containing protein n=1 Tax=Sphingobacterium sp. UT-1RO-CII-1 TaxID=2995225 RepID=UPI00227B071F|nr:helix-turn-helix transcriptional regulator [Sphingobacterium sp. UT-1RO-CII-1]MCY4781453.1 helix-turn-helix transcriptional regulator [Sphingobacterium sp. UT-1RO-CII-1]
MDNKPNIKKTFADNLKGYRKAKKLTQVQLAELLGLKRCSIGAYEEERAIPSIETIYLISRKLKVTMENLLVRHVIWRERD